MCENGMMMTAVNEGLACAVIFKMRCKRWSCPECAKINQDMWCLRAVAGAHELMQAGHELYLVTVTAHELHDVKRAVECLPSQWNKLRLRWRREVGKAEYILVPEVGIDGHFHIHLISDSPVGTRWWKDNARSCGFGYMNDESDDTINAAKTGFYVSKYLTKQIRGIETKKGFHRVRTSQGWPKLPPLPPVDNTYFFPHSAGQGIARVLSILSSQGYSVALADSRASWDILKTGLLTEGASWLTLTIPQID